MSNFVRHLRHAVARLNLVGLLVAVLAVPAIAAELAAGAAPPPTAVAGVGDVNVFPKRIVISGARRVASLGLLNRSAAPGEYDIDVSELVMGVDGSLSAPETVTDQAVVAGLKPASPFLIWSPHHVSLRGGELQMVRVMAHIPADLASGEYRSHFFLFANQPESSNEESPEKGFSTKITARFGISLPVIIRVGETTLSVALADLTRSKTDGADTIALTVRRSGTRSAYGDLLIFAAERKAPVAKILGVGIYPEIDHRTVKLTIDPTVPPAMLASGAKLTAVFVDDDMNPGKELARQEFTVP